MSLLSRFFTAMTEADAAPDDSGTERRRALAALLIHIAGVDGRSTEAETERVLAILGERYGLGRHAAERLVASGSQADDAAPDMTSLVDRLEIHDTAERRSLLLTAYQVAFADGSLHEFEDDLAWRLGHLLGFDDDAILAVQAEARGGASRP